MDAFRLYIVTLYSHDTRHPIRTRHSILTRHPILTRHSILTRVLQMQHVIQELLDTEEKYVADLLLVTSRYMDPMLDHTDPEVGQLAENVSFFFRWLDI